SRGPVCLPLLRSLGDHADGATLRRVLARGSDVVAASGAAADTRALAAQGEAIDDGAARDGAIGIRLPQDRHGATRPSPEQALQTLASCFRTEQAAVEEQAAGQARVASLRVAGQEPGNVVRDRWI